jgi:hypothetical protein
VLLRLAYLGMTNAFAMLRLLPMSDRDKDTEILALRHQITVLQRQLGDQKVRLQPSDRTLMAAVPCQNCSHRVWAGVLRLAGQDRGHGCSAVVPDCGSGVRLVAAGGAWRVRDGR